MPHENRMRGVRVGRTSAWSTIQTIVQGRRRSWGSNRRGPMGMPIRKRCWRNAVLRDWHRSPVTIRRVDKILSCSGPRNRNWGLLTGVGLNGQIKRRAHGSCRCRQAPRLVDSLSHGQVYAVRRCAGAWGQRLESIDSHIGLARLTRLPSRRRWRSGGTGARSAHVDRDLLGPHRWCFLAGWDLELDFRLGRL